ncbi:hypothetical protein [uncultured Chryseobacterium sp.]|uniref:hypothetical protein n=1 Tax=uncultured Chryseobacterium sp. TaxID=259322 RepID=UPI0025F07BC5|nr:hypothetical protein [uncultured Chryseobacterium sp.]
MDNTIKYLHLNHNGRNVFEIAREIEVLRTPLYAMMKIRELFPHLSIAEAKELVIIATTGYKSLDDYQGSLLPDLEEFGRILYEEENI